MSDKVGSVRVVPCEPTEEMWGGLARDIIKWMEFAERHTPRDLFDFLEKIGTDIPDWLRLEPELSNLDHAISKGTRAVIIYKAMLSASPPSAGWMPIESAPKDERVFFWIVPLERHEARLDSSGNPIISNHKSYRHEGKFGTWGGLSKAILWHPLPPPPTTGEMT